MNRCGDRRCRQQAHRIPPAPSNLSHRDLVWREYVRTDPLYDQPGPPRRSDISWQLVIEGLLVFIAISMFVIGFSLIAVQP